MDTYTLTAKDGISNLRDIIFRKPSVNALQEAVDVDIAEDGTWSLRPGRGASKFTGTPHSIDPKNSGLFMNGATLRRITSIATTPYTTISIATLSNSNPVVYASLPGRGIAVSNGYDIGIVKDDRYTAFSTPEMQYKRKMPGGQILTLHSGTLYVAKGNEIYYSDPHAYGIIDTRNKKKRFKGYITMMVSVDDGLYIADGIDTFFYAGTSPHEMTVKLVADYPAIYGMSATVERRLVGDGSIQGAVAYWLSSKGVCMGTSGGNFVNLTIERYPS